MKMAIKMQFCSIFVVFLIINELPQPTSQIPLNNSALIRLRKDTEVQSDNENNLIPPHSSPNQAPSSQPTNDQSTERHFLHFPKPKKPMPLNTQPTNPASIEATQIKTTNPLLPKLPSKLIDTKIGQSANLPSKAKSGQLSIKQTPATPEPTDTKLVSDPVKPKNKKPVPRKVTPPAETTENPPSASSKLPKKKKPALKSEEPTTESTTTLNPSRNKKLGGMKANNTENRSMNPPPLVPKIKHLTILSRSTPATK